MGNRASGDLDWQTDADSPSRPGELCVLSMPVTACSREELWERTERWIRGRPLSRRMRETARQLVPMPDGGLHEVCRVDIAGLAASLVGGSSSSMDVHSVYRLDRPRFVMVVESFFADETLTELATRTTIIFHKDPVCRIEILQDDFEARRSGPLLANALQRRLALMGYSVACRQDADSITEIGKKSVLSEEIADPDLTPRKFWGRLKAALEERLAGAALPDGSVVLEELSLRGTAYYKYSQLPDGVVAVENYLGDESMTRIEVTTYYRLLEQPKRVEAWGLTRACRRSGPNVRDHACRMFGSVMQFAEESMQA